MRASLYVGLCNVKLAMAEKSPHKFISKLSLQCLQAFISGYLLAL